MLLFYGGSILLSFMVMLTHLYPQLKLIEIVVASVPVGTVAGAWLFFGVAMLINFLSDECLTIGSVIMAVIFFAYLDSTLKQLRVALANLKAERKAATFCLPIMALFAFTVAPLYSSRYLAQDQHGQVWTGGSTWADLPIHLHMANSFLYGRNRVVYFDGMHSPVFAGEAMKYPFIPDFHAAVMVKFGASMSTAMWVPGAACFVAFTGLLFLMNLRVVKSAAAAAVSVLFVVFAGGFAGVRLAYTHGISKTLTLDPIQDDVGAPNGEVFWFGFAPHVMIPQRGATFAYPLVVFVMLLAWVAVNGRERQSITRACHTALLVTAAVVTGSLPLVQAHSCIGVGLFVFAMFALDIFRAISDAVPALTKLISADSPSHEESTVLKSSMYAGISWGLAGVVAIGEAWPQIKVLSSGMGKQGFFEPQYVLKGGLPGLFSAWWSALGPAVFLFFAAAYPLFNLLQSARSAADAVQKKNRGSAGAESSLSAGAGRGQSPVVAEFTQRSVWWFASAVTFLFGNFVLIQPWAKDNVKLLYCWLFAASAFSADFLVTYLVKLATPAADKTNVSRPKDVKSGNKNVIILSLVVVLAVLSCFSGVLGVIREHRSHHVLYGRDEIAVGEWMKENTRTEAVVLTKDTHRAPSGMIAGRPSLVAYTGWMWSHGYDYHERHRDREKILKSVTSPVDADATYLLYRWGIKYIVHEASSPKKEEINKTYLDNHVKRVFQSNRLHVFRVKYDGEPY